MSDTLDKAIQRIYECRNCYVSTSAKDYISSAIKPICDKLEAARINRSEELHKMPTRALRTLAKNKYEMDTEGCTDLHIEEMILKHEFDIEYVDDNNNDQSDNSDEYEYEYEEEEEESDTEDSD